MKGFVFKLINKLIDSISKTPCANCDHPVDRTLGSICVCSEECYDSLRTPETENKLLIN